MELVIQIAINWLILKWLVAALEPGLGDRTGPDHMELEMREKVEISEKIE